MNKLCSKITFGLLASLALLFLFTNHAKAYNILEYWDFDNHNTNGNYYGTSTKMVNQYYPNNFVFVADKWGTSGYAYQQNYAGWGMSGDIATSTDQLNSGFAHSIWVKSEGGERIKYGLMTGVGDYAFLIDFSANGTGGNFQNGYGLTVNPSVNGCTQIVNNWDYTKYGELYDGTWHNLIVNSGTYFDLYMDGTLLYSCQYVHDFDYTVGIKNSLTKNENYQWDMDDFAIFSKPLTNEEITNLQTYKVSQLPSSNNYIMYYGANPVYTKIKTSYDLPVVWNICDIWNNYLTYSLKLTGANFSTVASMPIASCSGTAHFNSPAPVNEKVGTSTIQILGSNNALYAETLPFENVVYNPIDNYGWIRFDFTNPVYINTATGSPATTTLNFAYNLCTDDYSTSTTICLKNNTTNFKTDFCTTGLTQCFSTASIDIPTSLTNYILNAGFTAYDQYNNPLLSSNPFMIVFYDSLASTTNSYLLNAHDLACSAEEWSATSEWLGLNFTNLKCHIFETALNIANGLTESAKTSVQLLGNGLKQVFPFSLANQFYTSWQDSENAQLPTDLEWLAIADTNGNVHLAFPHEWTGNATDTPLLVWGTDVFIPAGSKSADFFEGFRALTKYLMWAGFIFALYKFGEHIYEEINS